ncbi:Gfo/Idh/MocA family oxidoreductase [Candidatus Saganbacteria bacterium]|nr:Gfo/Idh/MocA family oxidoreductase [Candidatus Saganbacteria bacterium]
MRKLKLAFIGGGLNSAVGMTHKIASQMDGRFELTAGCFSPDKCINEQTAKEWHPERLYATWVELLAEEKNKSDVLVALTPTLLHADIIVAAVKSGYPVISEKALTSSVADARRIKTALDDLQGYLAVTFNYTGYPMLRELKSVIKQNRLGKIQQIQIEMPQEGFARLGQDGRPVVPQEWRLSDGDIPTISLDLGVHLHSIIYFLTGERPLEVTAVQDSFGSFRQIIDNVICIAKYSNGLICNIWYGKTALGCRNGLKVRVYGELGSAEWYQMDPERLFLRDNRGQEQVLDRGSLGVNVCGLPRYGRFKAGHPAGFIEAFANLYCDIADSITAYMGKSSYDAEYVYGIDEALEGLCMFQSVDKAAKNKTWVNVERDSE